MKNINDDQLLWNGHKIKPILVCLPDDTSATASMTERFYADAHALKWSKEKLRSIYAAAAVGVY